MQRQRASRTPACYSEDFGSHQKAKMGRQHCEHMHIQRRPLEAKFKAYATIGWSALTETRKEENVMPLIIIPVLMKRLCLDLAEQVRHDSLQNAGCKSAGCACSLHGEFFFSSHWIVRCCEPWQRVAISLWRFALMLSFMKGYPCYTKRSFCSRIDIDIEPIFHIHGARQTE